MQQIDLVHRLAEMYSDQMEIVEHSSDIMRLFKAGKFASLIGVEGLHQIANSASVLRLYYKLGVRYVTLAHNKNNLYADSAVSAQDIVDARSSSWNKDIQFTGSWWPFLARDSDDSRNESHRNVSKYLPSIVGHIYFMDTEMNCRIIDLSHTSEAVMHRVLDISEAPVIFSHSSM